MCNVNPNAPRPLPDLLSHCKNGVLGKDTLCETSLVWDVSICIHKVMSISKTCSNVMFFCKTQIHKSCFYARHFVFVRRVSWSHFWDMSGLKTCLCVLDCVFSGSIFFYFCCLRHVYCQDMSYISQQDTIFTVQWPFCFCKKNYHWWLDALTWLDALLGTPSI